MLPELACVPTAAARHRMARSGRALVRSALTPAGIAPAQTGILDEESPLRSTGYTQRGAGSPSVLGQQQVRPGHVGLLEGLEL